MSQERDMDFFRGVYQIETDFEGDTARLPVFYYDDSCITAIFPASLAKLRKILPKKDLFPLPVVPGVGAIAITAFNYRDTDIKPYNEISIAILVSYKNAPVLPAAGILEALRAREFHTYVHHLPVTTKIALYGGVEIYNLPKFLSEITFEDRGDHVFVELREKGEFIFSMKGKKIPTGGESKFRFLIYPVKDDRLQIANVLIRAKKVGQAFNPACVDLEVGNEHPIARELNDLLLIKKPLFYMYMPDFQAILYGPSCLE